VHKAIIEEIIHFEKAKELPARTWERAQGDSRFQSTRTAMAQSRSWTSTGPINCSSIRN